MVHRTWVTSDGDLLSISASQLPDKAALLGFCDEAGASTFLSLTRDEAVELADSLRRLAESDEPD